MKIAVSGWSRDLESTVLLEQPVNFHSIQDRRKYGSERIIVHVGDSEAENTPVWIGSKSKYIELHGEYRVSVELSSDEIFTLLFGVIKSWSVDRLMSKFRSVGTGSGGGNG